MNRLKTRAEDTEGLGFTRDADLVSHLVYRDSRVSQYQLRALGIKNPAQAINDAEERYAFKLSTGDALPNGDIPYTLTEGKLPDIAGTMPIWAANLLADAEDKVYVLELDYYECTRCWRHPLWRPTAGRPDEFQGVCGVCGPMLFRKIEHG